MEHLKKYWLVYLALAAVLVYVYYQMAAERAKKPPVRSTIDPIIVEPIPVRQVIVNDVRPVGAAERSRPRWQNR